MDDAKNKINVDTVKGLVQGDYNTVNIIESNTRQWDTRLTRISDLRPESLKLGDASAAKFPYVIAPIQDVYDNTVHALQYASTDPQRFKYGILIFGESNAGKTRLALEALRETLPTWLVLRWRPDYTIEHAPSVAFLTERNLVLFVDDLQDYVMTQMVDNHDQNLIVDPRATTLRTLIETLLQVLEQLVIVATCRIEDKSRTQSLLNWLFIQLTNITIPHFSKDEKSAKAEQIIVEFQKHGIIHKEDWDGTLGSIVLGLSTKNSQYLALAESHPSTATVLQAMKLLNILLTQVHTERRIRSVCANVLGKKRLLEDEDVWQEAVNHLIRLQFVEEEVDENSQEVALSIRKDAYFEQVVTDYPPPDRPYQFKRHLVKLQEVFVGLKDTEPLLSISRIFGELKQYEEALTIIDQVLAIDPNIANAWLYRSSMLFSLDRLEEALTTIDYTLSLNPDMTYAWSFKGSILIVFMRYEEALAAIEQAFFLDSSNFQASYFKSRMLNVLKRYEEALTAIDHTLSLDPNDVNEWAFKGRILHMLERYEEALTVFDHVLTLDPNNVGAWDNKISILKSLERNDQALTTFEYNLALDSNDAGMWFFRGNTLMSLDRFEEALIAINHALALKPQYLLAWYAKGFTLSFLERYEEALAAFEEALILDPDNAKLQYFKGHMLGNLERYEEALATFDEALKLDPKNVDTWLYKGLALEDLNRDKEALTVYEHILSLDSNNVAAWEGKAVVLWALGKVNEAKKAETQIKKLKSQHIKESR